LWRKGHPNTGEIQLHAHGLDISLPFFSKLPPKCCNHWAMPESSPHRYPTHILSHNHCHHMCIREAIGTRNPMRLTFIHTCVDISLVLCCQLQPKSFNDRDTPESSPHRYPTYIWSHNHCHHMCFCEAIGIRKSFKFTSIHGVDISLLLCSQLLPKSFNDTDMPESSPHRYPTHIRSHNH
jgi:hypothetical protein